VTPMRIATMVEWTVLLLTVPMSCTFVRSLHDEGLFVGGIVFGIAYAYACRFRRMLEGREEGQ
jgi:hypothetical protein